MSEPETFATVCGKRPLTKNQAALIRKMALAAPKMLQAQTGSSSLNAVGSDWCKVSLETFQPRKKGK